MVQHAEGRPEPTQDQEPGYQTIYVLYTLTTFALTRSNDVIYPSLRELLPFGNMAALFVDDITFT